jgi:probable HAF family extracellular repeat protein
MYRYSATVLGVLAVVLSGVGAASAAYLSIVDLGIPSGFTTSEAWGGINSNGAVAAQCKVGTTSNYHACVNSGGTWTDCGVFDATKNYSTTRGINDNGAVAGWSKNASGYDRPFLWTKTGGLVDLGTPADYNYGYGNQVNNSGVVAGYYGTSSTAVQACYWTAPGSVVGIQSLITGATSSWAYAINESGQMAGVYGYKVGSTTYNYAYRFTPAAVPGNPGTVDLLGSLGTWTDSQGIGINDAGYVVGLAKVSYTDASKLHAFLWRNAAEGMLDLGYLAGGTEYSVARDINNHDQIVGYVKDSAGVQHAALYTGLPGKGGAWVDLNTLIDPSLGWTLTHALGINDSGQITGYGTLGGVNHSFILTIPEPSTLALLAGGLVGLLCYAWRKRK